MLSRSLYIFVAKMVGYAIRIILPIFLVRILSMADYGAYRQFFLAEVLIVLLFHFGVNQSLYYFIPRDEKNAGAYFVNALLLNVCIYTVAFALIGCFVEPLSALANMDILRRHFWLLVLFTVLISWTVSCDCYLTSRQRIRASAAFDLGGQIAVSVVTLTVANATRDLESIITAMVLARSVQVVAMFSYIAFRMHGFAAERYFQGVWVQVRYGLVLGLGGTVWTLTTRLHEVFVNRYFGVEGYAVYSAGITEIPVLQFYLQALAVVALGQFAMMEKEGDWEGIRRLWDKILTSLYGIGIPMIAMLLIVSKPLVILMFTPEYAAAVPIFRINSLVKLHMLFNATLVLRAMNRNDVSLWTHLGVLVAAPFVLRGGLALWGMPGLVAGQLVLLLGGRLAAQFVLNRVAEVPLRLVPGPAAVLAFYRDSWTQGLGWIRDKTGRGGMGPRAGR